MHAHLFSLRTRFLAQFLWNHFGAKRRRRGGREAATEPVVELLCYTYMREYKILFFFSPTGECIWSATFWSRDSAKVCATFRAQMGRFPSWLFGKLFGQFGQFSGPKSKVELFQLSCNFTYSGWLTYILNLWKKRIFPSFRSSVNPFGVRWTFARLQKHKHFHFTV